jgi:hypothetical protein
MKHYTDKIEATSSAELLSMIAAFATTALVEVKLDGEKLAVDTFEGRSKLPLAKGGSLLWIGREGSWYEGASEYRRSGGFWVKTREAFYPHFDASYDWEVIYKEGKA